MRILQTVTLLSGHIFRMALDPPAPAFQLRWGEWLARSLAARDPIPLPGDDYPTLCASAAEEAHTLRIQVFDQNRPLITFVFSEAKNPVLWRKENLLAPGGAAREEPVAPWCVERGESGLALCDPHVLERLGALEHEVAAVWLGRPAQTP